MFHYIKNGVLITCSLREDADKDRVTFSEKILKLCIIGFLPHGYVVDNIKINNNTEIEYVSLRHLKDQNTVTISIDGIFTTSQSGSSNHISSVIRSHL